jgi:Antibiotic biosynthesis monooxygenase
MKLSVTGGTGKTQSAAEVGCRTYELSAQLTDPLTLRLFEEWDDAEALSVHFQTPNFKVFSAALPDLLGNRSFISAIRDRCGRPAHMRKDPAPVTRLTGRGTSRSATASSHDRRFRRLGIPNRRRRRDRSSTTKMSPQAPS